MTPQHEAQQGQPLTFSAYGMTDVGLKRPHNEDSIVVCEELGLFAVADGMGGHAAGEVASNTAINALREFIEQAKQDADYTWPFGLRDGLTHDENMLYTAIQLANRKVCQASLENSECLGMGTTIVALMGQPQSVLLGHVGDSRVYRLQAETLDQLTADHSWVNEQLQRNIITEEEARNHRWRNVITRALGNRQEIEIDLLTLPAAADDLFLLCSDGLTTMLDDHQIARLLLENRGNLQAACNSLINAANHAGGHDNISAILVQVQTQA